MFQPSKGSFLEEFTAGSDWPLRGSQDLSVNVPLLADAGKKPNRKMPVTVLRVPRQSICVRAVSIEGRNRTQVRKKPKLQ